MRKSYLRKLLAYMKKVFKIEDKLGKLKDSRVNKAKENKVFRNGTIDGYTVAAIDGSKLFGSNIKNCPECCRTTLKNGKIHKAHNAVFLSLVGSQPKFTIDFELYQGSSDSSKKDEGELTVAKRLLEKMCQTYNRLVNIVVYDVLACNSVWINHCINNKITPVVHVKENNISSIKEIKSNITPNGYGK